MSENGFDRLPKHVRLAAYDKMRRAIDAARRREPPRDGSIGILGDDVDLDGGMYGGGYTIQAMFVHDVRKHPVPYVVVRVFSGSSVAGSIETPVVYSAEDKRELARARLERLRSERQRIDREIAETEVRLAGGG